MDKDFEQDKEMATYLRDYVHTVLNFTDRGCEFRYSENVLSFMASALCGACGQPHGTLSPEIMRTFLRNEYDSKQSFMLSEGKEWAAALWLINHGIVNKDHLKVEPHRRGSATQMRLSYIYFIWFKKEYQSTSKASNVQPLPQDPLFFLGNVTPPGAEFLDSYWYLYSLNVYNNSINRHVVHIGSAMNGRYAHCKLENAVSQYDSYEGIAYYDIQVNHLMFYLVTILGGKKHLHIKIGLTAGVLEYKVLVGIDSVIGSRSGKANSEFLVLERIANGVQARKKQFKYDTGKDYGPEMPTAISGFLWAMRDKQMSGIAHMVFSLETLKEHNFGLSDTAATETKLLPYCQSYFIYLKYEKDRKDRQTQIYEMEVTIEQVGKGFSASITAHDDTNFDNYEQAQVGHFEHFIFIRFHDPNRVIGIQLIIDIGHAYLPDESECFPALVSGLTDDVRFGAAFKALVVRKNVIGFNRLEDERVKRYFEHMQEYALMNDVFSDFRLKSR